MTVGADKRIGIRERLVAFLAGPNDLREIFDVHWWQMPVPAERRGMVKPI